MDGSPLGELTSPSVGASASGSVLRWVPPESDAEVDRVQPASERVGSGPLRVGSGPLRAGSGPIRVGSGPLRVGASSGSGMGAGMGAVGTLAAVPPREPSSSGVAKIGPQASNPGWHAPQDGSAAVATEGWRLPSSFDSSLDAGEEERLLGVVLGDRYRVEHQIGAGGMGLVYKAVHLLIGRDLAIKVLRRRYSQKPEVAKRFEQEARIASSVKHTNVVDILDYGTTPGGSPYCVMEFLAGRSLARELAQTGPIDPARAVGIACDMARGLAAAHRAGVIHRDLKPDNVFLVSASDAAAEQVKLLDFGIAQILRRKVRLTAVGAIVGTPEYMSPEQARGDELDARSDLYALGIVLFEALTGRVPLSADSPTGTMSKQVFELAPRLREVDPRLAAYPSLEAAVAKLLAKNRDERPSSALEAAQLIQAAATNDLEPASDARGHAVQAGWAQPHAPPPVVAEQDIVRRATIMIGSGSVARAHDTELDGPATGSFSAKPGKLEAPEPKDPRKRPSIIIRDGVPSKVRPPPPAGTPLVSRTPTPESTRPLGKPPRGGIRGRHAPLILVALGAAIFAALVTIGFMRWLQRRDARASGATGSIESGPSVLGERVHEDGRVAARAGRVGPDRANTPTNAAVEGRTRGIEQPQCVAAHSRMTGGGAVLRDPAMPTKLNVPNSRPDENTVG
ncbi:serine/threonine-protein kinase [Enhygromyxa salina]|nr:serine/threonine-protein kinase [Enhygromyxa salina]